MSRELRSMKSLTLRKVSAFKAGYVGYAYRSSAEKVTALSRLFSEQLWSPGKLGVTFTHNSRNPKSCSILIPDGIDVRLLAYLIYIALHKDKTQSSSDALPEAYNDPNQCILDELEKGFGVQWPNEQWGDFPAPVNLECCEDVVGKNPRPTAGVKGKRPLVETDPLPAPNAKRYKVSEDRLIYVPKSYEVYLGFICYEFQGSMSRAELRYTLCEKLMLQNFIAVSLFRRKDISLWISPEVDPRLVAYYLYFHQLSGQSTGLRDKSKPYEFFYHPKPDADGKLVVCLDESNYFAQESQQNFPALSKKFLRETSTLLEVQKETYLGIKVRMEGKVLRIEGPQEKVDKLLEAINIKKLTEKPKVDPNAIILRELKACNLEPPSWYTNNPQPGAIFKTLPCSEDVGSQVAGFESAAAAAAEVAPTLVPAPKFMEKRLNKDEKAAGSISSVSSFTTTTTSTSTTTPTGMENLTAGESDSNAARFFQSSSRKAHSLRGQDGLVLKHVSTNESGYVAYSYTADKQNAVSFSQLFYQRLWSPNKAGIICARDKSFPGVCVLVMPKKVNVHLVAYLIYAALNKKKTSNVGDGIYYFDYQTVEIASGRVSVQFSEKNYVPDGSQPSFSARKVSLYGKLKTITLGREEEDCVVRKGAGYKVLVLEGSVESVMDVMGEADIRYHEPPKSFDNPNDYILQELRSVFGLCQNYNDLSSGEPVFPAQLVCCENVLEQRPAFESAAASAAASAPPSEPVFMAETETATTTTTTLPGSNNDPPIKVSDLDALLDELLPDEPVNISESPTGVAQSGFFSQGDEDEFVRDIDSWLKSAPGNE